MGWDALCAIRCNECVEVVGCSGEKDCVLWTTGRARSCAQWWAREAERVVSTTGIRLPPTPSRPSPTQELDDAGLALPGSSCKQNAFFHFQEWKKLWEQRGNEQVVQSLQKAETLNPPAFRVSTDGIRLLDSPR